MIGSRRFPGRLLLAAAALCVVLDGPAALRGDSPEATRLGREALRGERLPWYDAGADDVARGRRLPGGDGTGGDRSGREPSARPEEAPASRPDDLLVGRSALGYFEVLLFAILAAGLAWLAYSVATSRRWRRDAPLRRGAELAAGAAALGRTGRLPAAAGDLAAAARKARDEGRLADAIVLLYGHQLLVLDRLGWIRLERGKTNHEYLRELPRTEPIRGVLAASTGLFERSFYGGREVEPGPFEEVWTSWHELASRLEREGPRGAAPGARTSPSRLGAIALLILAAVPGCKRSLEVEYGAPSGGSLNGTCVLARFLESCGHEVRTVRHLGRRALAEVDCLVWFDESFAPASDREVGWLEAWLRDRPGRSVVYVVRDHDAQIPFLEDILGWADGPFAELVHSLLSKARDEFRRRRAWPRHASNDWFMYEREERDAAVRAVRGAEAWTAGLDPERARLVRRGALLPRQPFQTLLEADGSAFVASRVVGGSTVVLVANGCFLLNYHLVNREHRQLALALGREIRPASKVAFLDSWGEEPAIVEEGSAPEMPNGFRFLLSWPLNLIAAQLILVGLLYSLYRFPILGRPRVIRREIPRFERHVQAVGTLLEESGDRELARRLVEAYLARARGGAPRRAASRRPAGTLSR